MNNECDDRETQRLAIYETLFAQTRLLWSGCVHGWGAVLEQLRYRNGTTAYRVLLGPQAYQPDARVETSISRLIGLDPSLSVAAVHETVEQRLGREVLTACGTGAYYFSDTALVVEEFLMPMALTRERMRLERGRYFWRDGESLVPNGRHALSHDHGAEFGPGSLPHVLATILRPTPPIEQALSQANAYMVSAKMVLFQRYARHDPEALVDFLWAYNVV